MKARTAPRDEHMQRDAQVRQEYPHCRSCWECIIIIIITTSSDTFLVLLFGTCAHSTDVVEQLVDLLARLSFQ